MLRAHFMSAIAVWMKAAAEPNYLDVVGSDDNEEELAEVDGFEDMMARVRNWNSQVDGQAHLGWLEASKAEAPFSDSPESSCKGRSPVYPSASSGF
jgi:hypothetical protein